MRRSAFVCSLVLTYSALAAGADFRLGLNYAQAGPAISPGEQLAVDRSGALYSLDISVSRLTKLAADGKTVLWQQNPAPRASAMAVDPNGGIYLIVNPTGPTAVEKLSPDGATVAWKTEIQGAVSLAADASGRAFVVNTYPATLGVPARSGFVELIFSEPVEYAGPAPTQIAGTSQINFKASNMPTTGLNSLYLEVNAPSGTILSNGFRIYVAH